ncbi:MAG: acyltransferase family protein, partial [Akkermansia sp.]|nr:acyltransferase family protein [Akkermansia sp.]
MVLGHFSYAKNGAGAKHAIYAFHMSLFFVMAGCTAAISFAKTPSVSTFLRKKVVGVFVPYAVWCFLYRVPFTDISQLPAHYSFSEHLHCFVQGSVIVWFLICLFVLQGIYAVYKLVTRKFSGVVAKFATAGGLFILLFAMHRMWGKTSGEASCWALEFLTNAYKYYPAFAVGVLVIEYPVLFKKLFQNRFALFGYVLVFLFGIMIDKVSGYCGQVILGVGISLLIINLFVGIDYSKVQGWVLQGGVKQLKMYGKYTMAIYLFHNIFLPR